MNVSDMDKFLNEEGLGYLSICVRYRKKMI